MRMRRTSRKGGFLICLLINMLLNLDGLIPAILLLICHFAFGLPLWLTFVAIGLWLAGMIIYMLIFGWYYSQDSDLPQKSKQVNNPYAKKGTIIKNGVTVQKPDNDDK